VVCCREGDNEPSDSIKVGECRDCLGRCYLMKKDCASWREFNTFYAYYGPQNPHFHQNRNVYLRLQYFVYSVCERVGADTGLLLILPEHRHRPDCILTRHEFSTPLAVRL
jgi:hypothetical protein